MSEVLKEQLNRLIQGETFNHMEAEMVMNQIMEGKATASQIAGILSILRFRGEAVSEITGFVSSMRRHAIQVNHDYDVMDTCGTGGDGLSTFNVSTTVAIILAAMGVKIAKHGNRAMSSKSGSADVLEQLDMSVQSNTNEAKIALENHNMCFLYAPLYHSSMKYAANPRKELGFRTIFNILGPLVNPARSRKQLIGVYDHELAIKMGEALQQLGTARTLLVTGENGLDELSISGPSHVVSVHPNEIKTFKLRPEDVGLPYGHLSEIQVKNSRESAGMIMDIIQGKNTGTPRNMAIYNAGAALYVYGQTKTIEDGVNQAREALESGQVFNHFNRMRKQGEKKYA